MAQGATGPSEARSGDRRRGVTRRRLHGKPVSSTRLHHHIPVPKYVDDAQLKMLTPADIHLRIPLCGLAWGIIRFKPCLTRGFASLG